MELQDIKKIVNTTYHYTDLEGNEHVFKYEQECYDFRKKDVYKWWKLMTSNRYLRCKKGLYLITCNKPLYEGMSFIILNGMVILDDVLLDKNNNLLQGSPNIFLSQAGRLWSYGVPRELRNDFVGYLTNPDIIQPITACWNGGWFSTTYEESLKILTHCYTNGYKITELS